jgi:hypothetical protein
MMEAVSPTETSVSIFPSTRRNIPQDSHLHTRRLENLTHKSVHKPRLQPTSCRLYAVLTLRPYFVNIHFNIISHWCVCFPRRVCTSCFPPNDLCPTGHIFQCCVESAAIFCVRLFLSATCPGSNLSTRVRWLPHCTRHHLLSTNLRCSHFVTVTLRQKQSYFDLFYCFRPERLNYN